MTISRNKNYYRQLLDDQFVLVVHCRLCRPSHEHCSECERMLDEGTRVLRQVSQWAQTGLGEGEMTYRLLKAEQPVKLHISLTIPHVIRYDIYIHVFSFHRVNLSRSSVFLGSCSVCLV